MFETAGVDTGYSINGGAGASLAVRSGERGKPLRLRRARGRGSYRSEFVNSDVKTFTPLGFDFDFGSGFTSQGGYPTPGWPGTSSGGSGSGGGGFDWSQVFGVIQSAGPAIITAIRGQGVPAGYYPSALPQGQTQQMSQIPPGYVYQDGQLIPIGSAASAGAQAGAGLANLGNSVSTFVTQNPLLVLGGVVGLLLLFKSPPSRR